MIDKFNQQSFQRLRLNLRQLEVFLATARGGSTRAAADRIARSQSAASTSLADLEAALGVELFDRVGRRLQLYENGRALSGAQQPEDVTGSVVWLLSDLSRFVTGQLIPVNGGFVFN